MPELPEVEVTRLAVENFLKGRRIAGIVVRESRLRWPVSPLLMQLQDLSVEVVKRRAKYLLVHTHSGTLIIHLGMSGRLYCLEDGKEKPKKHDHIDIILDNQKILRYTDPRRFGAMLWSTDTIANHPLLCHLGPEPFCHTFNADYLFKKLQGRKTSIKQFIMDQEIVVGVGNIYANEALFLAKILPERAAKTITLLECQRLVPIIQSVLRNAIEHGGTTLKDFASPEGKAGYFVQKLLVYGRAAKKCYQCGAILQAIRLGNRATVFCADCQH